MAVARLDPPVPPILSVASVIGQEFDLEVLAGAAAQPPEVLIDALDAAGAAGFVQEQLESSGSHRFTHALIQRVMYLELGVPGERRFTDASPRPSMLFATITLRLGPPSGPDTGHWRLNQHVPAKPSALQPAGSAHWRP